MNCLCFGEVVIETVCSFRTLPGLEQITWGAGTLGPQHIQQGLCRRRCVWPWCPSQLCFRLTCLNLCPSLSQAFKFLSALTLCHLGFPGLSCESCTTCWVAALVSFPRSPWPWLSRALSLAEPVCTEFIVYGALETHRSSTGLSGKSSILDTRMFRELNFTLPYSNST